MTDQERIAVALIRIYEWTRKTPAVTGKTPQESCGYPDAAVLREIKRVADDALRHEDEEHTDDGIN